MKIFESGERASRGVLEKEEMLTDDMTFLPLFLSLRHMARQSRSMYHVPSPGMFDRLIIRSKWKVPTMRIKELDGL